MYNDGSLQGYKHHILHSIPIIWSLKPKKLFNYSEHCDFSQKKNDFSGPFFFFFSLENKTKQINQGDCKVWS